MSSWLGGTTRHKHYTETVQEFVDLTAGGSWGFKPRGSRSGVLNSGVSGTTAGVVMAAVRVTGHSERPEGGRVRQESARYVVQCLMTDINDTNYEPPIVQMQCFDAYNPHAR